MSGFKKVCMVLGVVLFSLVPVFGAHKAAFVATGLWNEQVAAMRKSGFDTVICWSLHVNSSGQLSLNNDPLIYSDSSYNSAFWGQWSKNNMALLKTQPTSITRIEFSVGSAGAADFEGIEHLVNTQGTGPTSTLYKNFAKLLEIYPQIDAINFDDESNYDVPTTTQFAVMLADLGYKITFCPYSRRSTFWGPLYDAIEAERPGAVDHVYLQCYAGGAFNNPATWNAYFGSLKVEPGLWAGDASTSGRHDPSEVQQKMEDWRASADIPGGFIWRLAYMSEGGHAPSDYAAAIDGNYLADFDDSTCFKIISRHSGKALSVLDVDRAGNPTARTNNAAEIAQWTYTPGEDWSLWQIQDTTNGFQKIINKHSGKAMTIFTWHLNGVDSVARNENWADIAQYTYFETQDWYHWRVTKVGDSYKLINKYSNKAAAVYNLDAAGTSLDRTADGADVAQYEYLGDAWYNWDIVPVTPTSIVYEAAIAMDGGSLNISFTGLSNQTFMLQSSSSLTNSSWVDEGIMTLDATGEAVFSEASPTNDAKFYRMML